MLQISEIVKKTEEMFDLFNEHFYNKELTRPAITVSPDGGRGAYGWCSIHEIWNADENKYREINLSAEYLTTKHLRRKLASYETAEGFTRYYYSDELEEYEETKLHRFDWTMTGTDTPCEAETIRSFPYDYQVYIL